MNTALYESLLGTYVMGEDNGALVGLWLMGQKYFPKELPPVGSGEGRYSPGPAAGWMPTLPGRGRSRGN